MELVYGETLFTTARAIATTDNTEVMLENGVCVCWGGKTVSSKQCFHLMLDEALCFLLVCLKDK